MVEEPSRRLESWIVVLCLLGGVLLTVIGTRYFFVPESAARTFGVAPRSAGYELHYIIGIRNVWLGLLAIGFALLRQWPALMLWLALGALVCFADAAIAATSSGRLPQVAFHLSCGFSCAALALAVWGLTKRS